MNNQQVTDSSPSLNYVIEPGGCLSGSFKVPGDKSISHRAVMLGAIAEGTTTVTGFLEGEDSKATISIFRALGVSIAHPAPGNVTIHGAGKQGLKGTDHALDCGNSGTTMRLLSGLLAAQPFGSTLVGDGSLMKRPMERVAAPLRLMNARIKTSEAGRPPVVISAVDHLKGIDFQLPVPSAQVKSAVLLAGLYASGITKVIETVPSRDHTERMLQAFGCRVERQNGVVSVAGNSVLQGTEVVIPGDISSAAFFLVATTITPNSEILLLDVGVNPTRTGIIEILNAMGGDISLENHRSVGGEPIANLRVKAAQLTGIEIPEYLVPLAIDEFPAIFIAAACADGETILRGAGELRVKESDRIETMAEGLRTLGIEVTLYEDGMKIVGSPYFLGGHISSYHDHRIAMAFSIAALRAKSTITIDHCEEVSTSFPGFVEIARQAGLSITEKMQ